MVFKFKKIKNDPFVTLGFKNCYRRYRPIKIKPVKMRERLKMHYLSIALREASTNRPSNQKKSIFLSNYPSFYLFILTIYLFHMWEKRNI